MRRGIVTRRTSAGLASTGYRRCYRALHDLHPACRISSKGRDALSGSGGGSRSAVPLEVLENFVGEEPAVVVGHVKELNADAVEKGLRVPVECGEPYLPGGYGEKGPALRGLRIRRKESASSGFSQGRMRAPFRLISSVWPKMWPLAARSTTGHLTFARGCRRCSDSISGALRPCC